MHELLDKEPDENQDVAEKLKEEHHDVEDGKIDEELKFSQVWRCWLVLRGRQRYQRARRRLRQPRRRAVCETCLNARQEAVA